jgi:hypothetical protein
MVQKRRRGFAALAFVIALSIAPLVSAEPALRRRELPVNPRERIVRIIDIIKKFFGGVTAEEDGVTPPRP